jgi:hypothetical protein
MLLELPSKPVCVPDVYGEAAARKGRNLLNISRATSYTLTGTLAREFEPVLMKGSAQPAPSAGVVWRSMSPSGLMLAARGDHNYLIGNNDAHGKNLSPLNRGTGTENLEVRLASLYDIVSTV